MTAVQLCCTVLSWRFEPVGVNPRVHRTPGKSNPETCLKPFLDVYHGSRRERECNVVVEEMGSRVAQRW